jgi:hypothetical protein
MPVKTSPMDSERPKTPSWDFSAPDLVKNSKSYGLCHFSPSSSATCSPFCTCGKVNLAFERFHSQNPASTRVPQNAPICRTVTRNKAPEGGGTGRMGPCGHVPRFKIGTCLMVNPSFDMCPMRIYNPTGYKYKNQTPRNI